jgi:hypothetical protein
VGGSKLHHYVPQMSLRRFSSEPERENPPLWALAFGTGKITTTSVRNEAAVNHYNRIDVADTDSDIVERALSEVESKASFVFNKVSSGQRIGPEDQLTLALFLQLQHQRTPRGRENLRFVQSQAATLYMQVELSNDERVKEFLESEGKEVTPEAIEAYRTEMLELFESGDLMVMPGWNNEVFSQLALTDKIPVMICERMTWNVLRAPQGREFIVSDHPVHIYDPEAFPDRNGAWLSSPQVSATFPIDRKTCLLLQPGPEGWRDFDTEAAWVRDINLKSYASSKKKCYGSSQRVLEEVWKTAKRNPKLVAAFRPKPPRIVLLEKTSESSGTLTEAEVITGPSTPEIRRYKRSPA